MNAIRLTVNGRAISDRVEPRTHLADFLRERINLTGTHLRCEQGVCGTCTLLIDGQPARSCITYAVLCDGATITTIEGLDDDPIMAALRRAFSEEHGLQCGFCTPGMLVTARDIIMRLPGADEARIRTELSGNLCRCTGYVGIVRAIRRVLKERAGTTRPPAAHESMPLGPVGARPAQPGAEAGIAPAAASVTEPRPVAGQASLGLGERAPNIEIRQTFTVSQSPEEVWRFFADIERVVTCLPGASLTRPPAGDRIEGTFAVKLGPITASFGGDARIIRDDARRRGTILGAGRDRVGGSRAAGEAEYALTAANGGTRVDVSIRVLLSGPLAQFGRSGIVDDLAARITKAFASNLEAHLTSAGAQRPTRGPLNAGSLLWEMILARLKAAFARIFGSSHS